MIAETAQGANPQVRDGPQLRMLRTAMGPDIAAALDDPEVVEVMLNPDGSLWVDRLGAGRRRPGSIWRPRPRSGSFAWSPRCMRRRSARRRADRLGGTPGDRRALRGRAAAGCAGAGLCDPQARDRRHSPRALCERAILTASPGRFPALCRRARLNILIAGGTSHRQDDTRECAACKKSRKPEIASSCSRTRWSSNASRRITCRCAPSPGSSRWRNSCARPCACAPIGSWSAKCAVAKRSICLKPGAPDIPAASRPFTPAPRMARCIAWSS